MKKTTLFLMALLATQCFLSIGYAQSLQWAGTFGGNGEDVVAGVHNDANGNFYTTGYFSNYCDFDISDDTAIVEHGDDFEIFVSKYNNSGELQWVKTFGGPNGENGIAVTTDTNGNVYITGIFQDQMDFDPGVGEFFMTPAGYLDTFILKLDANGEFVWAKSIAGIDYEQANGIGTDAQGNVYLTGFFFATTDFDPGTAEFNLTPIAFHDCFALKLNNAGEFVWAKQFGGNDFDFATALKVTETGDMFIAGSFSGQVDFDPNPTGEFLLSTTMGYDGCFLLHLNGNGNFVSATKVGESTFRIFGLGIDIDTLGSTVISGYFGGIVTFTLENGSTATFDSPNFFNGFVTKILPTGQIQWAKYLDSDEGCEAFGVVTNSLNEVFVSGFFDGVLTSDSTTITKQNTMAAQESFMIKMDADGNTMAAYQFGGADFIDGFPISIDQNDNVYLSAAFQHTIDLNPMPNVTQEITSVNFRDNFIIKMDNTTLSNPDFETNAFSVYPNPAQEQITIQSTTPLIGMDYTLTDMTGRVILNGKIADNQNINVDMIPSGTYIVTVGQTSSKIIKY